jgi:hypothetical protein
MLACGSYIADRYMHASAIDRPSSSISRLKGSTLLTEGVVTDGSDEWAIYGGTGEFAMARGVVKRRYLADRDGAGNTDELSMQVFCPVFGSSQQPNKQARAVLYICPRERNRQ